MGRRSGVVAGWAVLVVAFAAGCGSGGGAGVPDGAVGSDAAPDGGAASDGSAGDAGAQQPGAQELILAAEQSGAIDHDTALYYLVLAEFDRGSLPADLRGAPPTKYHEMTSVFTELYGRFPSLTPELQAKVDPFMRRPDDPQSYWYLGDGAIQGADGGLPLRDILEPVTPVDVANAPIRVWIPLHDGSPNLWGGLVTAIQDSDMYANESAVMQGHDLCPDGTRGGNASLDVYLLYPNTYIRRTAADDEGMRAGAVGVTLLDPDLGTDGCRNVPFVLMTYNPNITDPGTWKCYPSVMAHELFHAFEATFSAFLEESNLWFHEADATWAEDYVFPDLDCEQDYLHDSKWNPQHAGPLDAYVKVTGDSFHAPQYGAYLYPFLLTRAEGRDPTVMGEIWDSMSFGRTAVAALAAQPGWDQDFKDFALWNWNRGPALVYADHGVAIASDKLQPLQHDSTVNASGPKSIAYALGHTEIQYEHVVVDDLGGIDPQTHAAFVNKLAFQLGALKDPPGSVQAIVQIEGQDPVVQDWSGQAEVDFCRDQPDQKVVDVVLVLANGGDDTDPEIDGAVTVAPQPPCPTVGAYLDYDATVYLDAAGTTAGVTQSGSLSYTQHVHADLSNFVELVNILGRHLYSFASATAFTFDGGGSFSWTTDTGFLSGDETDAVTAQGTVHNPAQAGEWDAVNGASPPLNTLDLRANGDGTYAYQIAFASGDLPYARTLSTHIDYLCVAGDPAGTSTEDSVWDPAQSAIVTTDVTCGGDTSQAVGSETLLTSYHPLDELLTAWSGTYNPTTGDFDVVASTTSTACPDLDPAIGGVDPYWPADSLPDAPTACSQQATLHIHIPKPAGL